MQFIFSEFNSIRYQRGADAARVEVVYDDGESDLLWMAGKDVVANVMQFGPHLGLLAAAVHYSFNIEKLIAQWKKSGDKRFLSPVEPTRSQDGYWRHPDWPTEEREAIMDQWLDKIGYECHVSWLSGDEAADAVYERYNAGDTDILAWEPQPPEHAAGWFIVSIHDHEDGPVCIWVRQKQ